VTARRLAAGIAILGAVLAVWLARPARFVVDGLSMAPGLMPDDLVSTGWLPAADRLHAPARFERWLVAAPDGSRAVKRIAGLPGEAAAIRDGDLVVGGTTVLKGPSVLAEMAVPLAAVLDAPRGRATLPPDEVLDDVGFAREVNRSLEPVRDAGLVALLATGTAPARLRATVAGATIQWRLPAAADVWVIAGQLDGRIVAVAWRDHAARPADARRSGLPGRVPEAWSIAATGPIDHPDATRPPCGLAVVGDARLERAAGWRDVHLRPAADGVASWQLDAESYLVLGDFPTGSIDSRQWGPLPAAAVRCRIRPP
jgi:type IV secretory pathway protease TraF